MRTLCHSLGPQQSVAEHDRKVQGKAPSVLLRLKETASKWWMRPSKLALTFGAVAWCTYASIRPIWFRSDSLCDRFGCNAVLNRLLWSSQDPAPVPCSSGLFGNNGSFQTAGGLSLTLGCCQPITEIAMPSSRVRTLQTDRQRLLIFSFHNERKYHEYGPYHL